MTHYTKEVEGMMNKFLDAEIKWVDIDNGLGKYMLASQVIEQAHKVFTEYQESLHHQLQKAREGERERIANGLDELMEKLADIEHVRWAKWQNYLHSHLTWNNEIQAWVLPHEWKDRWQMQINKPYSMLSEKEKESDREQVRLYLELIKRKIRDHSELDQDTELLNSVKEDWDKQAENAMNGLKK